jgi:hypothetical protein
MLNLQREETVADMWILIKPDKLQASLDVYLVMPATGKLSPPPNTPIKQCMFVMETCNRPPHWHVHQWRTDIVQRNFWLCDKHLNTLLKDKEVIEISLQLAQFADLISSDPSPSPEVEAAPAPQRIDRPVNTPHLRAMPQSLEDLESKGKLANRLRQSFNRLQRQIGGLSDERAPRPPSPSIGKVFNILLTLVSFSVFFYAGWQSWSGGDGGGDFTRLIGGAFFILLAAAIDFLKSFWGGISHE